MPLLRDLMALYGAVNDPDKAKRDAVTAAYASNLQGIQQLVDSGLANNPQAWQSIFGRDPRFGGGGSQPFRDSILSMPLSPTQSAKQLEDYQNNPNIQLKLQNGTPVPVIGGPSVFQGMPIEQRLQIMDAVNKAKQQGKSPDLLTPEQKDLIAKNKGLPTQQQSKQVDSSINAANASADEARARATGIGQEVNQKQVSMDMDKQVTDWKNQNGRTNSSLLDLWLANDVPGNIKDAIAGGASSSKQFDAQYGAYNQQQMRNLEAQRLEAEKSEQGIQIQRMDQYYKQMQYVQAADTWRAAGMLGGQQTLQGLQDAFSGQKTPAADAAMKLMGSKVTDSAIERYNTNLRQALEGKSSGKLNPDEIQTLVDAANTSAGFLNSQGIPVKLLRYGRPQATAGGITGAIQSAMGGLRPNTISTVDGSDPSPIETGDALLATQLVDQIQNHGADLSLTLNDKRATPAVRALVMQKLNIKKIPSNIPGK